MNKSQALSQMISPSQKRLGKPKGGVVQIHVTRACDLSCFGCTQGSNLRGNPSFISVENFGIAVKSLKDYFGIVGIFGGNPALHPQFPQLCEILRKYIPKEKCGLWCNHPRGHGVIMRETFNPAVSNLNVHLKKDAYTEFRRTWPEAKPFGLKDDSRHSPPYTAMKDLIADEEERWDLISECDINKHWSAMICEIKGEVYGYFCEIAGAQAILHQFDESWPITGVPIVCRECRGSGRVDDDQENIVQTCDSCRGVSWWRKTMQDFESQVLLHCHACGVPLKGYGALAQGSEDQTEQVTTTHAGIYKPKRQDRIVQLVEDIKNVDSHGLRFTEYLQGAKK